MLSEQERFWTGEFAPAYRARNRGSVLERSNEALFRRVLESTDGAVGSAIEFGCGIGLNLKALHALDPLMEFAAYEINEDAAREARNLDLCPVVCDSVTRNLSVGLEFDLAFTKGLLIHIAPDDLPQVYANLVQASGQYVMVCEYYNPTPVEVEYRGHGGKLWKRDFAGELIDGYGLKLVDYGFAYHRGPNPQDDTTWFLLEKE